MAFKIENSLLRDDLSYIRTVPKTDPITAEWIKQNAKIKAILNFTIEDNQIIHVKHLENAKDIWEALKAVRQITDLFSKLVLL